MDWDYSGEGNNFTNLLQSKQARSSSEVYDVISAHLNEFFSPEYDARLLYLKYYPFIFMGLDNIRNAIANVSHSKPCGLLGTYYLLLDCLLKLYPILKNDDPLLFDHWGTYIKSLFVRNDIGTTKKEIRECMELLGIKQHEFIVPVYNRQFNKIFLTHILDILLVYTYCLSQSCNTEDARELVLVIKELDPWMKDLDGDDMKRRSLLVENLMETSISYHDDNLAAERIAVTLLEHNKVCKDARMQELGMAFVRKDIGGKKGFLRRVIGHLDHQCQCQVASDRFPNMNVWAANLMQLKLHEITGRLHPTIFITMQSLILDGHAKDILCDKGCCLLKPMTFIADARAEREKGIQGLNNCLAKLDEAINLLHKCNVKGANDLGSLYFLQAQALCLRALSRYENCNSNKIIWCKGNFTEDIEKALKLVTNTYFSDLAAKYNCLSKYISKLFCFVFDILIMEHDENDHRLLEEIISLCEQNCDVMWQFKSHHSHLKSELMDNYFSDNCNFLIEEGESREEPERMVSNIASKVTKSLKSSCRAAQFYYDQGERMLLMGKMTKALKHASEGRERQYDLLKDNFDLATSRDANVYTLHMNHIVAARAWSMTFEEFIVAPNINFICYLNSILQEATILELIGDGHMAMAALKWGKSLSVKRGPSFYLGRFHAAISRIYRKTQEFSQAEKELIQAEELCRSVSCKKCRLLLKLEISKENVKQKRKNGITSDITTAMQELLSVELLLKGHLNAKPCGKGREDSKYRCRCWECTCRFSLLTVLKEKGKDYVFKDETRKACNVFLENMHFVVSLSSLPSLESPRTLYKLFELVMRKEIKVVHGTHIAELIYIISWVACMMGESDGDFLIPNEMLIATLKHALILSSETPELLKKVAQLLAIMYLPGYFNKTPLSISENSLTQCHWACFFHELTVGSGVNYLFSLRLSKVYGDDCDPDDNLHWLTTSSDVDRLDDFVSKFYSQLQPHTILVINILGNKYKKLLGKQRFCMPSEDAAFLMISRFSTTREPLVDIFQVNPKGSGRQGELWQAPWGTNTIVDTILPDFKWIVKGLDDGIPVSTLDARLSNIIGHMESWLGQNKYIMLGELADSTLPLIPSTTTKRNPVIILVLDKDIQMLPWESMKELKNQDVYRMPSVSSIFYNYLKCDKIHRKAVRDRASYATLDPSDAYYVINPTGSWFGEYSLSECLKTEFCLEGICQKPVVVKDILEILKTRNLFIYVGHGDGLQHIAKDELAKLDRCAAAILMGCCSGLLELNGPYTPKGAPIDYLLAGSPIVIGNLWSIRRTWALKLTRTLLKTFEGGMKDEAGIVTCLDLARKTSINPTHRALTICYGVPTLLRKRIP